MRHAVDMTLSAAMSPWTSQDTVSGFEHAQPNAVLMQYAARELARLGRGLVVDVGCGAARNAAPLARMGWRAVGTDLSSPMLAAAVRRARLEAPSGRLVFARAPMTSIPMPDASVDLVVAHGIWNLAESSWEFRTAVAEAARVAKPGTALFVFTFSRNTLPGDAPPVPGETFIFTQFSGRPKVFLTARELVDEMSRAGFDQDAAVPLTEYNLPSPGTIRTGAPVIYEAAFRKRG